MKKNWYAVYTKLNCEFKVAAQLHKKKITSFCPVNSTTNSGLRKKNNLFPLFESVVFVQMDEVEMNLLRELNGIVNFLYWQGKPAIISNEEIKNIERFANHYQFIEVKRIAVSPHTALEILTEPNLDITKNNISGKYTTVKMKLPSLGYCIMASIETSTLKIFDPVSIKKNVVV